MSQIMHSRHVQDEIATKPTPRLSSSHRIMASLVSLDVKASKNGLSQAITDRYPTGTSNNHITTGIRTTRHQTSTNSSLSSNKGDFSPARSIDVLHSLKLPKKVRVKALLPKFDQKTASMQKEEESESPQRTHKTESSLIHKREKTHQRYDDYSISELRASYNVKSDSKQEYNNGPSSPKLPSIPRKITGDDTEGVDTIKMHKTLLTQGNNTDTSMKESSLSPLRSPNAEEKGSSVGLKLSRNVSHEKGSKVSSEEKTPRMFFGRGNTKKLFDLARVNVRKEMQRVSVASYGGSARNLKISKVNNKEPQRKELKIKIENHQEGKTNNEPTKKDVATNQKETSSKHNSSPDLSPKHRSLSHFGETGPNTPNTAQEPSKALLELEKARLSIEELGQVDEQDELQKVAPNSKPQGMQHPLGSPVSSPKKNMAFKRAISEVGYLPSPQSQGTPKISKQLSLKKIIPEGSVIKRSGFGNQYQSPVKRNRTLTEDLTETYEESMPNSPAGPINEEEENRFKIFKDSDGVNFFELNEEHFLLGGEFSRSNRRTKTFPSRDNDAVIVSYSGDKEALTIRPRYMEDYGTMCFTELWSTKSKTTYKYTKNEVGLTRKVHHGPEDPLHRPGLISKKNLYESMIKTNQKELSTPTLKNYEAQLMSAVLERQANHQESMSKLRGVVDMVMKNNQDNVVARSSTPKKMSVKMVSH